MSASRLQSAKRIIARIPGLLWLKHRLFGPLRPWAAVPIDRPKERGPSPSIESAGVSPVSDAQPGDRFVLYRIIGNDLVPRHRKGQSRDNLAFILKNEPELEGCEKRFVVNRIVDADEERAIIRMLEDAGMPYLYLPFEPSQYRREPWDIEGVPLEFAPYQQRYADGLGEDQQGRVLARLYRHKNNYAINNNGARNAALSDGRARAGWILPWDGNCFVSRASWASIRKAVLSRKAIPYWIVPMARVTDNRKLLDPGFQPAAEEEPQILFRADAALRFNSDYFYGRRPKVELFWRLGIPGKWDEWPLEPWDLPCPEYADEAGHWGEAGWVARLFSGERQLEEARGGQALIDRGLARMEAIGGLLDTLDERYNVDCFDPAQTVFVSRGGLETADQGLKAKLLSCAEEALERGPYSVVDKTTLPPSGNRHDYWHPAPYYWPHPLRIPGLPYVRRDGERVPGTRMYEPLSDRYDRTRLQRLFDDGFILALAATCSDERKYGEHAAQLLRTWFLDPATAMNPHLNYAQVRRGHHRNRGVASGIIEMKDMYYFLDAARLLSAEGYLTGEEQSDFKRWLRTYLDWLLTSDQGREERRSSNNHGTYFDLQVAAIALYLGDYLLVRNTLRDSRFRIIEQFANDGRQVEEMKRTATAHYCSFNLQGWIHLAQLGESVGEDLWGFEGPEGQSIECAMAWLMSRLGKPWPYQQIDEFDAERFYPIYYVCRDRFGLISGMNNEPVPTKVDIKAVFFPHYGIRPFWQIGRT